jgi:hypothetical protein
MTARAANRLYTGSQIVAGRIGRAFVPQGRPVAAVARVGAAVWLAPRILDLAHQAPLWLVGGTCAWCIAAWRAETKSAAGPQLTPASPTAGRSKDFDPDHVRSEFMRLLGYKLADRKGVHLADIAEELHAQGMTDWDAPTLRRQYEAYGIPVRSQLYIDGRNRAGIHRDDLQPLALPQERPEPLAEPA